MSSADASDFKSPTDQDIFHNVFSEICVDKDTHTLDLTQFLCGLIKFGINSLSNKEMEDIFNWMNTKNRRIIDENDFINFLITNVETNEQYTNLQRRLINKIYENYSSQSNVRRSYNKNELTQSSFFEFCYIPLKPSITIYNEYETEIETLKLQLEEAKATLDIAIPNMESLHLTDNIIPIMPNLLSSSQSIETIPESLIHSSLEPTTNYNPLMWNINDVIDWLQMIDLSHYIEICKLNQINGNKLLCWSKEEFANNLQFENEHDIDKFMQEIDILKETAPPIDDLYGISDSESNVSTGFIDNKDIINTNTNGLEETPNVTSHTIVSGDAMVELKLNERDNTEIDRLKSEIQRIELSKLDLVVSTSAELQKLRDIIKQCT